MEFKGWSFVEINGRGALLRHGHVIDRVTDDQFLVQIYANEFTCAEMVKADAMMSWKLFPDKTELQRFMNAHQKAERDAKAIDHPPDAAPSLERVPSEDLLE